MVWIFLGCILVLFFLYKVYKSLEKIRRRGNENYHIPEIKTRNKRKKFFRRFKYLEGLGD